MAFITTTSCMFSKPPKLPPRQKAAYSTQYKIGDRVTVRADLNDYTLYTSQDGVIYEYLPHNATQLAGCKLTVKDIVDGRYVLGNSCGASIPGLWVDGMLKPSANPDESQGYSLADMEQMLPEVAAYFASSGMTLEQWEEEFRKNHKRIEQMISYDRITKIAKLARQAQDATDAGEDASKIFKQIADAASEDENCCVGCSSSGVNKKEVAIVFAVFVGVITLIIAATSAAVLCPTGAAAAYFFRLFKRALSFTAGIMFIVYIIGLIILCFD